MLRRPPPLVKTAWVLIILLVGGVASLQTIPEGVDDVGNVEDAAGLVIVRLQAEFILGQSLMSGGTNNIAAAASVLDTGTVGQRQRYMAFMIGLGDIEAASLAALRMQAELTNEGMEMTEKESKIQEMLDILVAGGRYLPEDYLSLEESLGWFGTFLQADEAEREAIESLAVKKVIILTLVVLIVSIAAIVGLVFLILKLVKAFDGKMKSGLEQPASHHGVYAEVFALWILVFVIFTSVAAVLGQIVADGNATISLVFVLSAFFGSLVVLFWARIRGVPFKQIRKDIGWTTGNGFLKEVGTGIFGYAMTLPILCVGVLLTLLLFMIQQFMSGGVEAAPFRGTGGGSHPIIVDLANGVWSIRILLIFMAAVAAPVVEETVFRGVLYRQLRSSSCKFPKVLSIACSVFLVSFVFAAIHPQGWVAIPALMSIAVGMNLLREWRGSLIPSMVVHGLSNGIVVSMMVLMLG